MFQTFSGSSKRIRQVNLSGQNVNPFGATGWGGSASGTQKAVANAQQGRQQRQQERDRQNASKKIQRVWRGHRVRRELADSRRSSWDEQSQKFQTSSDPNAILVGQAQLIVTFFNRQRQDDIERLDLLSQRISNLGYEEFLGLPELRGQLLRLADITLRALQSSLPYCSFNLLQLLVVLVDGVPLYFPRISKAYYRFLSKLCSDSKSADLDRGLFLTAIKIPLIKRIDNNNDTALLDAHADFALHFLTTPNLASILGNLDQLASIIDVGVVSAALVREFTVNSTTQLKDDSRLWLLAHFIALHRLQRRSGQEPEFIRALSMQLSNSSRDILGRIDATDPEVLQQSPDDEEAEKHPIPTLPTFVKDELLTLVNQESITGLLAKFNVDYAKASAAGEEDASLLASYALTLLRMFPRRGDEIRMWLYLGSMTTPLGNQLPALKFFWQAMRKTSIFAAVRADSKSALVILRAQTKTQSSSATSNDNAKEREWRTILLFLELYTFVLRFTDDEEFLAGGNPESVLAETPTSRIRASALPLEDVQSLTLFLKNLAFTTYYNAGELCDDENQTMEGGLGSFFATTNSSIFQSQGTESEVKRLPSRPFAGVAGMTFTYVRTIVAGVMRMLYERDSRRPFLPKGHWLMTSRFDMEGFIPSVVLEEERQHEVREAGGEEEDTAQETHDHSTPSVLVGNSMTRRAVQIESMRRQQAKAARKMALAAIGPRLEVLQNMPFVIPFETRVQIFRQFVLLDQMRRRNGCVDPDIWRMTVMQVMGARDRGREVLGRHHARIRRGNVFDDAYEQFYELRDGLKEPIQITFVDQFDTVEAGIDGGGVTKEFLTSVTNEAFKAVDGPSWFVANDQQLLYPNPSSLDARRQWMRQAGLEEATPEFRENLQEVLRRYEFLGRIVGKCLYEGILIDISFAGFFLLKWAAAGAAGSEGGYRANINDLRDLDERLYQGLLKLKNYPGNVEDFALDFTITDEVSIPGEPTKKITRELMPNGSNISVTNENRPLYVSYVARHRLQVQPYQQTQAFLKGLGDIIKPSWLSMFNQAELQTLIGGDASEIDVDDLRENTMYGGVYQIGDDGQEHHTVKLFWQVLKNLDDLDRRKVLKYVTSTPRAPLLGFSQLNPRFSIRDGGSDEERLPSTSTCVNLLKLPRYSTASVLKSKLLYAVNSGAGFDLS